MMLNSITLIKYAYSRNYHQAIGSIMLATMHFTYNQFKSIITFSSAMWGKETVGVHSSLQRTVELEQNWTLSAKSVANLNHQINCFLLEEIDNLPSTSRQSLKYRNRTLKEDPEQPYQDSLNYSLLKGIANSCFKLKILSDTSKTLRFYLEREDGTFELLSQDQVKGIPQNKLLKREIYDHFFIKLTHEDGRPKVQFCGKLVGGSKIPFFDEVIRSIGSLGDVITGNPEHARKRWQNWTEDSFLASTGKSIGFTVASGATALVGQTETAKELIEKAGDSGQKLGGMAISSLYQAGGVAGEILTLGIPNPVSGALTQSASRLNEVIDKNVQEGRYGLDWKQYTQEGSIGLARGSASIGGLIPYVGTAVEKSIKGEEIQFNHKQQLSQWGINAATTAISFGAVKGMGKLTAAGKIGMKTALGSGFILGTVTGVGSGYLSQQIHTGLLRQKIQGEGYQFSKNEQSQGVVYAIYTKKGYEDIIVPCPNLGDAIGNGLLQGVMLALTAGRQYKHKKPIFTDFDKIDEHQTFQKRGPALTADEVIMKPSVLKQWEVQSSEDLATALQAKARWIKITSKQSNAGMQMISKVHPAGTIEVAFLQHAGNHEYGPFEPGNREYFGNMLKKVIVQAHEGGQHISSFYLLGCEVTEQVQHYLLEATGFPVKTLPHIMNSSLEIVPGTGKFRYLREVGPDKYQVIFEDKLQNIFDYMS